jgi:outer membrane protein assembly factor BamD (BamD/ComL family)
MKFRFIVILSVVLSLITGCKSMQNVKNTTDWDLDRYMNEAQKLSNKDDFKGAVALLKEACVKFPDEDLVPITYNIGFYYYKMKKHDDATGYFNNVIKQFESGDFSEAQKIEDRKFVALSTIIIDKMKKDKEYAKDPYAVKEDLEKNKKVTAKKEPVPGPKPKEE